MVQETTTRTKRAALGRGLSALIPPKPGAPISGTVSGLMRLPVEKIAPNPEQPRHHFDDSALAELADSIREHGVLQPLVVRKDGPSTFSIVAGERRWRAAQKAGLMEIPAIVSDRPEEEALLLALVENLQREDLNPIEEAEAFSQLQEDLGLTQEEIAERVGKERSTVTNSLRLLKLPEMVRNHVLSGELSMGHARALLGLADAASMERVAREILRKKLSVRDVERRVKLQRLGKVEKTTRSTQISPAAREVTEKLMRSLSTKVQLKEKAKGKGLIQIHFHSYDELDRLISILCAH